MGASTTSGEARVVTDPFDGELGLRLPKALEAEIVTVSRGAKEANHVSSVGADPFIIRTPGEYEVHEIFVFGIPAPLANSQKGGSDHVIFRYEMEHMRLAHLGALDRKLTDAELASLENIDVLFVPVGGGSVLAPAKAIEVIEQVEPRVVVPMYYELPGLKEELGGVEAFCQALGLSTCEPISKLKLTRKDLPEDEMRVIVLSKS